MTTRNAKIAILCIVVVFVRLAGFAEGLQIADGARGVTIAAGLKGK